MITRLLTALLLAPLAALHAAEPLSVSGIYPHLTVFNSGPKREKPEPECGLGAAVPSAGKLWSTTMKRKSKPTGDTLPLRRQ